jgi:predicted dehydrogenase
MEGVTLAWVATRNPETVGLLPSETRVATEWRDVLAAENIDGVVIATPPATHAEILIAALDARRAVLVEKPLTICREELAAIEQAAGRSPATVVVDHTHLFHPAFRALKSLCVARGGPLALRSMAGNFGPYRHDVSVLWDWAPHDIAMALELCPGPVEVSDASVLERKIFEGVTAERIHISLILSGGTPCDIVVGTLDPKHRWFATDVIDGTLIYSDQGPAALRWFAQRGAKPDELGHPIPVPSDLPLKAVVSEFADAIREGRSARDSLALGCQVVDVVARCQETLRQ